MRLLLAASLLLLASAARADHEFWSLVGEKWILEGTGKAARFHALDACTGIVGTLPYFARVEGAPCANDATQICLADNPERSGWYIPIPHFVVILPVGNSGLFEHEAIHHKLWLAYGDIDFHHLGPEWRCLEARPEFSCQ